MKIMVHNLQKYATDKNCRQPQNSIKIARNLYYNLMYYMMIMKSMFKMNFGTITPHNKMITKPFLVK